MDTAKYKRQYFMPPTECFDWVQRDYIEKAPIWCSVDLRDGNQALIEPMNLEEKLEFFDMLVGIGFKEIEVGFPAASDTEFAFIRALIEQNRIPDDVTIQVLTQAREHIIRRTFEAVKGAPSAVVHLYNSTSVAQREQVFRKDQSQIRELAVSGAKLLKELAEETEGNFSFEYSPESFHGTEVDYALSVCNAVLDVWHEDTGRKIIINIPATVETAMPHVFASQIEYLNKNLKYREDIVLSVHPHNDRGGGVSDAELGVLAGADRVEGTLFGNGERTGNVDLITLAMNMVAYGIEPGLDFSCLPKIRENYERLTGMRVHERHPYAGDLVYTAFSGSHQDAIAKGYAWIEEKNADKWEVPYLPIDPEDVGRSYDGDVIRINSQSGKGGVSYILKHFYSIAIPDNMKMDVGYAVKAISDKTHKELTPDDVFHVFEKEYIQFNPCFQIPECHFIQRNGIIADVTVQDSNGSAVINTQGNGRLDAVSNALKQHFGIQYRLETYEEHALSEGSSSEAISFVGINQNGKLYWGAGRDEDIIKSSIHALTVAVNKILKEKS